MRPFAKQIRVIAFALVGSGLSVNSSSAAEAEAPKKRSFRPVTPIKHVVPDTEALRRGVVTVTIPPPPIPQPDSSLFPAGSVPVVTPEEEANLIEVSSIPSAPSPSVDAPPAQIEIPDESELVPARKESALTLARLREEAHKLADQGLTYQFGSDDPDEGGLDCSGAIQHLLKSIGVEDVPRTSYNQYYWLKREKTLDDVSGKNASAKMLKKLSPGDLIFWGGTWKSGHKVSHVMLYMGYDPNEDKHYIFGARGKNSKGLLGNGVDIFELDPERGSLVAHGKIPGLQY